MNRRAFLSAILATGIAPAICRAEWLMKGSGVIVPSGLISVPNGGIVTAGDFHSWIFVDGRHYLFNDDGVVAQSNDMNQWDVVYHTQGEA